MTPATEVHVIVDSNLPGGDEIYFAANPDDPLMGFELDASGVLVIETLGRVIMYNTKCVEKVEIHK